VVPESLIKMFVDDVKKIIPYTWYKNIKVAFNPQQNQWFIEGDFQSDTFPNLRTTSMQRVSKVGAGIVRVFKAYKHTECLGVSVYCTDNTCEKRIKGFCKTPEKPVAISDEPYCMTHKCSCRDCVWTDEDGKVYPCEWVGDGYNTDGDCLALK